MDDEWQERLRAAVAETLRLRARKAALRAQFADRRAYGLQQRHTTKLRRQQAAGDTTKENSMTDITDQIDRLDSVRPCSYCQGLGEVDATEFVDENDLEAVRKELIATVASEGDYGLTSEQRSLRIRMASRVIWLANRVIWLENHENVRAENDARYAKMQETAAAKRQEALAWLWREVEFLVDDKPKRGTAQAIEAKVVEILGRDLTDKALTGVGIRQIEKAAQHIADCRITTPGQ